MRREGSPWTGLWTITAKETADHLTSMRMRLLEILVGLTAAGAVYATTQSIRETVGEDHLTVDFRAFVVSMTWPGKTENLQAITT